MSPYRLLALASVFALAFAGLGARLAYLQSGHAGRYIDQFERRRLRVEQVPPTRGRILDRHGRVLAVDLPTHDLWLRPVEFVRADGRRRPLCLLAPLEVEDLRRIGNAAAGSREFLLEIAARKLADANAMLARLAEALPSLPDWDEATLPPPTPAEARLVLARHLLRALAERGGELSALATARPWLEDVGSELFMELVQRGGDPEGHPDYRSLDPRLGRRRHYPAGAVTAHIVGTCTSLTAENYADLRGRWREDGGGAEPGTGEVLRDGRVFFSILPPPGTPPETLTDEERILQLRTTRRGGRLVRSGGFLEDGRVGDTGVEAYYNQRLRGRHRLQVSRLERPDPAAPRQLVPLGGATVEPENGEDLTLTIDLDLQRDVRELLLEAVEELAARPENVEYRDRLAATAIVMNPHNGALYAMVSVPDYDPNTFRRDYNRLSGDPAHPLLYHAIGEYFQPGSVIKPLVGLAALEDGKIDPNETVECTGQVTLADGSRYRCMQRSGHGPLDLEHALMVSCNPMFYELGRRLSLKELTGWLYRFGLGHRTGVDIAGERPGILPRGWISLGERFYLATGQGPVATTPLQMAVAYASLANAGRAGARVVRPHVLRPAQEAAGDDWRLESPRGEFPVDRRDLDVVRHGMWLVVQGEDDRHGTGHLARMPLNPAGEPIIEIAGKTGSAELDAFYSGALAERKVSHAWFCGYAPVVNPEVVVVVLVEYGDRGGMMSAPLARKVFQRYFEVDDSDARPDTLPGAPAGGGLG